MADTGGGDQCALKAGALPLTASARCVAARHLAQALARSWPGSCAAACCEACVTRCAYASCWVISSSRARVECMKMRRIAGSMMCRGAREFNCRAGSGYTAAQTAPGPLVMKSTEPQPAASFTFDGVTVRSRMPETERCHTAVALERMCIGFFFRSFARSARVIT